MGKNMSLSEVIKTALDQIKYIAKTETVIGEPIRSGGVTLIPVSRVSIGFAAGGGDTGEKNGSGAGTGGGVNITPVAFISIIDEKVNILPINKNDPSWGNLLSLAPDLIKQISKFVGKKDKSKEEDNNDDE
jgi:uncharacterized spore protein YtfJ